MVKNKVKISALGTANHIPFIFNIFGNINKPIVINPNVRRKDNKLGFLFEKKSLQ